MPLTEVNASTLESRVAPGLWLCGETVALRWDERELGVTLSLFGIDVGEGWLVGRLHFIGGLSTEMMFTRSASRWSDGYFLGGWEWKNAYYETHDGVRVEVDPYRSEAVCRPDPDCA